MQRKLTAVFLAARIAALGIPMIATAQPGFAAGATAAQYKDGTYVGPRVDAYWGIMRVQAVIQNGKLVNVQVLEYPADRQTSKYINGQAIPMLQSEVMSAQSANVNIISGATLTSEAYLLSLDHALSQAVGGANGA